MMNKCEWEPYLDRFKCKYCGTIVPRNTIQHICKYLNNKDKDIPSLIRRGYNVTKAGIKHLLEGRQTCTDEQKQARYDQCKKNECGLFREHKNGGICAHDDCGCFLRSNGKFLDKIAWADSKCPEGYWGPIVNSQENDENGV